MRWFGLAIVSMIGWALAVTAIPFQILFRLFYRGESTFDTEYYFRQIAVGNDVMVGAMMYGSKHTVSAITGHKSHQGGIWHKRQERVIDFFFGKNHCYLEAVDEKLIKDEHEELIQ